MLTSDRPENHSWARWQPDDLLGESLPVNVPLPAEPAAPAPGQLDAELSQLRHQAQQQGISEGQQRGREEGHAQGYEAGFRQGQEAGFAQGMAQAEAAREAAGQQAGRLLANLQETLEQLHKLMPARLVQHALTAARQIIGDSLAANPQLLSEQLRQALQDDRWLQQDAQLWVNPQDVVWAETFLAQSCQALGWAIRSDENLLPGGCKLTYASGELDATLERRWQALCRLSREDLTQ